MFCNGLPCLYVCLLLDIFSVYNSTYYCILLSSYASHIIVPTHFASRRRWRTSFNTARVARMTEGLVVAIGAGYEVFPTGNLTVLYICILFSLYIFVVRRVVLFYECGVPVTINEML
jgi:hypothetical protein